jgi:hypothetical protein
MTDVPFQYDCPRCHAKASVPCQPLRGNHIWPTATHLARWRAAGIDKPTREQINANNRIASQMRRGSRHRIIKGGYIV